MYSDSKQENLPSWRRRAKSDSPVTLRSFVAVALFSLIAVSSGIGYLKQKEHTERIGEDIKQLENSLETLKLKNRLRESRIEQLKSPQRLEQKVKEMGLGLRLPEEKQVLRLGDPTQPELNEKPIEISSGRL